MPPSLSQAPESLLPSTHPRHRSRQYRRRRTFQPRSPPACPLPQARPLPTAPLGAPAGWSPQTAAWPTRQATPPRRSRHASPFRWTSSSLQSGFEGWLPHPLTPKPDKLRRAAPPDQSRGAPVSSLTTVRAALAPSLNTLLTFP